MISERVMESWQWIFVFFAVLMIARIVPRIIKQRKMKLQKTGGVGTEKPFFKESDSQPFVKKAKERSFAKETVPESKDMMVLGQINRGYKTFGQIKKNTGLGTSELNSILEDLEKQGLMRVEQKKGMLGIKIELHPTEKGYRKYDS